MAQLPVPGSDSGTWGTILNEFLGVSLNSDGTIQTTALSSAGAITSINGTTPASGAVTLAASDLDALPTSTKLADLADTTAASGATNNQILTYNSAGSAWVPATPTTTVISNATTNSLGIVELAGDLGGTATSPSVLKVNGVTVNGTPTTGQGIVASNGTTAAWSTLPTAPVTSVNSQTGAVVLTAGSVSAVPTSAVGANSGVASLNSTGQVPTGQLATGTGSTSNFLRGDGTWSTPTAGSSTLAADTDVSIASPANNQVLTYNSTTTKWVNQAAQTASNATTGAPGLVQLAGDLGGSGTAATAPMLAATTNVETIISANTTVAGALQKTNNLSDVASATTAFGNIKQDATGAATGVIELTGDLGGTATNPTVARLNGITAPASAPSGSGQVLTSTSASATAWSTPSTNASSVDGVTVTGTPSSGQVITATSGTAAGWATPATAPVTTVFGRAGAVVATTGDYTAAQVTGAASTTSGSTQTFTGNVSAPAHIASGLTGATAASRYVGATASGAPASGTFIAGDFVIDQTAKIWVCTTTGSPGTWTQITASNGGVTSFNSRAGAVTPTSGDYTAAQVTGAASTSSASQQTFTGNISAPAVIASGLTGATAASRYVGATASGAPASGTFAIGDFVIDQTAKIWVCTTAGSPGTWTKAGLALDATSGDIQALGTQAAGSTGKAADAGHVHPTTGLALATGGGEETVSTNANATGAVTLNLANGNVFNLTLTGNVTFTFSGATNGVVCSFGLYLTQDATGSRTATWPGSVLWAGGIPPTLSTAAGAVDVVVFETLNGGTSWFGSLVGTNFIS